jgi:hypothetical protein
MTIKVEKNKDGTFDISWDQNDPQESMFNTWTESDFIDAISKYLDKLKESESN